MHLKVSLYTFILVIFNVNKGKKDSFGPTGARKDQEEKKYSGLEILPFPVLRSAWSKAKHAQLVLWA